MLVERARALQELRDLFAESVAGHSRVAVLTGPVGSGKTALLRAFTEEVVATGAVLFDAVGSRSEHEIPNEILRQLLRKARLAPPVVRRIAQLLDTSPDNAGFERISGSSRRIGDLLLETAENSRQPLVIAVDDAHHADVASLQALLFLVRRFQVTPTLLLLTEATYPHQSYPHRSYPLFHAELPRAPVCGRIRLRPLSVSGVGHVLAQGMDVSQARTLAPEDHALSGGLPLLVRALAEDHSTSRQASSGYEPGEAYERALSDCLYRFTPSMFATARALAFADVPVAPEWLGKLAGIPATTAELALAALDDTGLLAGGRFRDSRTARLIRDATDHEVRTELHLRTARLLHKDGAEASAIATHLVAAERVDLTLLPVLHQAAETAMEEGGQTAGPYLRLAQHYGATVSPDLNATTEMLLLRGEWRVDPAQARRRLPALAEAVGAGHLTGSDAITPVVAQLWFGQVDNALDALAHLGVSAPRPDVPTPLHALSSLLSFLYPGTRRESEPNRVEPISIPVQARSSSILGAYLRTARALGSALTHGPDPDSAERAKHFLDSVALGERTLVPILLSLFALVANDQAAVAESRSDELIDQAAAAGAPTWQALLCAIRAEISLRRGNFAVAGKFAAGAFELLPAESWGVLAGFPLATAITAATLAEDREKAGHYLRVPVPDALFQTPVGLLYLLACGRFQYEAGNHREALDCFDTIGRLTAAWEMDLPSLLPWRTASARVYLRLDQVERARLLATEEIRRCPPSDRRTLASALRALAATQDIDERAQSLAQAVAMIEFGDDHAELAATLTELGWAQHTLGEDKVAQRTLRKADRLMKQSGSGRAIGIMSDTEPPEPNSSAPGSLGELSHAERRVAMLAANGHSNRDIANKLFVTVSTVEQHLTRAYRKLNVRRRSELVRELRPSLPRSG